ncbi:Rhodanese-like domain protein [Alkalibacterium sp. AK22]|uniref:rhodanese-like domain-containing protein n=1 Tax=Alkalibacterium sp. AK22 TaxID=1229520 RepID=UPI00044A4693|nr:rhodanese-like domain-containing protein [Alkalibacterium sp. AK22]EXJ22455.1 Rhodanese-like domain protein [Alkalibacterium sp. AK22]
MDNWTLITIILWIGIIAWGIWELVQFFRRKKAATVLSNEEFKQDMRKAQIVDVRGKDEFDAGHILGARNIPYMQLKQRAGELRKDQPIYLYDDKKTISFRSALLLQKKGFENLYILKDGYSKWDGKIKRKKTV